MRVAEINGKKVSFDLSGRKVDSYSEYGDQVKYLGEGKILTNVHGKKVDRPKLKYFWKWNR